MQLARSSVTWLARMPHHAARLSTSALVSSPDLYDMELSAQVCPSPVPGLHCKGTPDADYLPDEACYPVQSCAATGSQHAHTEPGFVVHPVEVIVGGPMTFASLISGTVKVEDDGNGNGRVVVNSTTSTVVLGNNSRSEAAAEGGEPLAAACQDADSK